MSFNRFQRIAVIALLALNVATVKGDGCYKRAGFGSWIDFGERMPDDCNPCYWTKCWDIGELGYADDCVRVWCDVLAN